MIDIPGNEAPGEGYINKVLYKYHDRIIRQLLALTERGKERGEACSRI